MHVELFRILMKAFTFSASNNDRQHIFLRTVQSHLARNRKKQSNHPNYLLSVAEGGVSEAGPDAAACGDTRPDSRVIELLKHFCSPHAAQT